MGETQTSRKPHRRGFIEYATGAMAVAGAAFAAWPLIRQMSPDASVKPPTNFDLQDLAEGESLYFKMYGLPHILRHRTQAEASHDRTFDAKALKDPFARNANLPTEEQATFENRSFGPGNRFVLMSLACTHLGCILRDRFREDAQSNRPPIVLQCPCHSAKFDSLGRVWGGPALSNLPIPRFELKGASKLVFGFDTDVSVVSAPG